MYEIKYKESPNNLIVVKIELKTEISIYVNIKIKSAWQNVPLIPLNINNSDDTSLLFTIVNKFKIYQLK